MANLVELAIDLTPWRQGVRNAAALVKRGLGEQALDPFDRAVRRSARLMRERLGAAATAVRTQIGRITGGVSAIHGLIAAIAAGALIGKLMGLADRAIEAARNLQDAGTILETAAKGAGVAIDTAAFKDLAKNLQAATGAAQSDVLKAAANFIGRGFTEDATKELLTIAAGVRARIGGTFVDAGKKIADALGGSPDSAKDLGIKPPKTGNPAEDARQIAAQLQATYGGLGEKLANSSNRFQATLDDLVEEIGRKILPKFDEFMDNVTALVIAWREGFMSADIQGLLDDAREVFRFLRRIIDLGDLGTKNTMGNISNTVLATSTVTDVLKSAVTDGIGGSMEMLTGYLVQSAEDAAIAASIKMTGMGPARRNEGNQMMAAASNRLGDFRSVLRVAGMNLSDGLKEQQKIIERQATINAIWAGKNPVDTLTNRIEKDVREGIKMGYEKQGEAVKQLEKETRRNAPQDLISGQLLEEERRKAREELAKRAGESSASSSVYVYNKITYSTPSEVRTRSFRGVRR